jgi:uncharacterized membrane protein
MIMLEHTLFTLTFAAAIGSGLVAGIFFAFSAFVMAALGRILPEQGIAVMQSINITVLTPAFLTAFLGTGVVCVALAAGSYVWWGEASGKLLLASLIYLVGCIGVTMICNVPLNDALAAVRPNTPEAAAVWSNYLTVWTNWNHLRTVAPLLSAILFMAALV